MNVLFTFVWSKTGLAIAIYIVAVISLGGLLNAQLDACEMMQYARPMDTN